MSIPNIIERIIQPISLVIPVLPIPMAMILIRLLRVLRHWVGDDEFHVPNVIVDTSVLFRFFDGGPTTFTTDYNEEDYREDEEETEV
jgi:hypothetical protein